LLWQNLLTVTVFSAQGVRHGHHRHKNKSEKHERTKSIDELRAERLRREQQERQRTEQLLATVHGTAAAITTQPVDDDRQRRYNSQFNPDIARRPRPRDSFT